MHGTSDKLTSTFKGTMPIEHLLYQQVDMNAYVLKHCTLFSCDNLIKQHCYKQSGDRHD